MDSEARLSELKERHDVASGARDAAEDLAWWIAALAGFAAYFRWHQFWPSLLIGAAVWYVVVRYYGGAEEAAEDAYFRAAGLGKYWQPRDDN